MWGLELGCQVLHSAARLPSPQPFLSPVAFVGHVARQQEKQLRWLFNAQTPKTMKTDFWQGTPPRSSSTLPVFFSHGALITIQKDKGWESYSDQSQQLDRSDETFKVEILPKEGFNYWGIKAIRTFVALHLNFRVGFSKNRGSLDTHGKNKEKLIAAG